MKAFVVGAFLFCFVTVAPVSALRFDGVDGVVDVGNPSDHIAANIAVECWMRTTTSGGGEGLVARYEVGKGYGWRLYILGSDLYGEYAVDGSNYCKCTFNDVSFDDGVWHHAAFVADRTVLNECYCYTDGALDATGTWVGSGTSLSTADTLMGKRNWGKGVSYYTGDLDEVRIWDPRRTLDEIRAYKDRRCSGTEPNLVGYYRLDEGAGTTAVDLQDNVTRNNGTHSGGVTHVGSSPTTYGE